MNRIVKRAIGFFIITIVTLSFVSCTPKPKESGLEKIIKEGKIRVGISPGYLPFELKDKGGSLIGFDVDIARIIGDSMGVNVEFIQVTGYDELIPRLINGDFDIILSGMSVTQKRNLNISFSEPYIITGQTILVNPRHKTKVKSYNDLNSALYRVVYEKGTTAKDAIDRLFPKCRFFPVDSPEEGLDMLKNEEADALVNDQPFCSSAVAKEKKGTFIYLDTPITFEPIGIGIRNDESALLNWMNNFIRQIQADGRYDDLYANWFMSNKWMKRLK